MFTENLKYSDYNNIEEESKATEAEDEKPVNG
jgi:hypothetical protein